MPEILLCGSEGEWGLYQNTLSGTGSDNKRRGSVNMTGGVFADALFSGSDDTWVHVRMAGSDEQFTSGTQQMVTIYDSSGLPLAGIKKHANGSASDGTHRIQFFVFSGTGDRILDETVYSVNAGDFVDYDIRMQRSTVTSANDSLLFSFYFNLRKVWEITQTKDSGWLLAERIRFQPADDFGTFDDIWIQDFIVSDGIPTVGMELTTLIPNAAGNYADFTNDYTSIDEPGFSTSDNIFTSTLGDRESWTHATPTVDLSNRVIHSVGVTTVAQTSAPVNDYESFVRISGVDYAGGTLGANDISPECYFTYYEINPDTATDWVSSDFTSLETGVHAV